ncbi:hypothetical protein BKA62DRAFT_322912 [Auriculariales sp. MPI-PUGE-AT-0066]|nr:hypothetical protein BKA62DRAFT_322912 [Auriculariales sp. MPI-PUGE-AT-0066]
MAQGVVRVHNIQTRSSVADRDELGGKRTGNGCEARDDRGRRGTKHWISALHRCVRAGQGRVREEVERDRGQVTSGGERGGIGRYRQAPDPTHVDVRTSGIRYSRTVRIAAHGRESDEGCQSCRERDWRTVPGEREKDKSGCERSSGQARHSGAMCACQTSAATTSIGGVCASSVREMMQSKVQRMVSAPPINGQQPRTSVRTLELGVGVNHLCYSLLQACLQVPVRVQGAGSAEGEREPSGDEGWESVCAVKTRARKAHSERVTTKEQREAELG